MIGTIITGIVGCVCGNIAVFLFLPQIKKAKNIENEAKQSEEWKKLYIEAHQEITEKDRKIGDTSATFYLDRNPINNQRMIVFFDKK